MKLLFYALSNSIYMANIYLEIKLVSICEDIGTLVPLYHRLGECGLRRSERASAPCSARARASSAAAASPRPCDHMGSRHDRERGGAGPTIVTLSCAGAEAAASTSAASAGTASWPPVRLCIPPTPLRDRALSVDGRRGGDDAAPVGFFSLERSSGIDVPGRAAGSGPGATATASDGCGSTAGPTDAAAAAASTTTLNDPRRSVGARAVGGGAGVRTISAGCTRAELPCPRMRGSAAAGAAATTTTSKGHLGATYGSSRNMRTTQRSQRRCPAYFRVRVAPRGNVKANASRSAAGARAHPWSTRVRRHRHRGRWGTTTSPVRSAARPPTRPPSPHTECTSLCNSICNSY